MGCCENGTACACRPRRGSSAGVIAKALTLLVLGVGVGAAHSVMQPVKLHPDPTAPIQIEIPGPTRGTTPETDPTQPDSNSAEPGAGDAGSASEPSGVEGSNDPPVIVEPLADIMTLGDTITLDETRVLWETGKAQFIDARRLDEYVAGHIPRSILVDPADIRAGRMPEGLLYLDFDAITVIYCGGGDCDSSENAKRDLQQMGFTQLHIFRDGFPTWEAAALPVNVGEPGASAPRPAPGGGH